MRQANEQNHVPCLLWPFWAIWKLAKGILKLTGRVLSVVFGFILVVIGIIISMTVIGAIIGVPLAGLGVLLIIRGLF